MFYNVLFLRNVLSKIVFSPQGSSETLNKCDVIMNLTAATGNEF